VVPAERVIKGSLLTPASAEFLAKLQPLAVTASNFSGSNREWLAWRAFSLALMEYRFGHYDAMEQWYRKSTNYSSGSDVRAATFQTIRAMAHYRTGNTPQAHMELAEAWEVINARTKELKTAEGLDAKSYWFDWMFADILLREAEKLINH
jgi:hypothetical protein